MTLPQQWLRYGGRDAHTMAPTAFWQMWTNHQDQRQVSLAVGGLDGEDDITIREAGDGPMLRVAPRGEDPKGRD